MHFSDVTDGPVFQFLKHLHGHTIPKEQLFSYFSDVCICDVYVCIDDRQKNTINQISESEFGNNSRTKDFFSSLLI